MPINPTAIGATTSTAIQRLMPSPIDQMVLYAPSIMNSPWARLITRIIPKMTASPAETITRLATA